MAPRAGSVDQTGTPEPVEKGIATINTLRSAPEKPKIVVALYQRIDQIAYIVFRIGVKAFVEKVRCSASRIRLASAF